MADILLCTLNARYNHASLGLRYLAANLGELRPSAEIVEFTIAVDIREAAEQILAHSPKILGLGVYIWNREPCLALVGLLRRLAPDLIIVLGGPEVSHELDDDPFVPLANHVITGWGDLAFAALCHDYLVEKRPPSDKILLGGTPQLHQIALPYDEYTDEDIRNRFLYVEASRGCPFRCQFCLSALDKTAWPFELAPFLAAMDKLYQRGARHFKFVDRTFNLKMDQCEQILAFFLERLDDQLFLHFELIPDALPERLRPWIQRFPPGSLQFEIGVQSWTPEVQQNISRRQNNQKTEAHLAWLKAHAHAHLHADLIFGLPGETLASFAEGFDRLVALAPHEIQLGILKRLKGAPIVRYEQSGELAFEPTPPFRVIRTKEVDFATIQRVDRAARYWDTIANSGRFPHTLPLLLGVAPFERLLQLSDFLHTALGRAHSVGLPRLFGLLYKAMQQCFDIPADTARAALAQDHQRGGFKFQLHTALNDFKPQKSAPNASLNQRQQQHRSEGIL